jgi:glycine/D-amino acid oxidase-like deaminating enzyme
MDLRSGHPYWLLKNGLIASYPTLRHNEQCEVAIIGGGVTGALTAYYLTKAGVDVVLLDKRDVANGSTAASTALLQYAADSELVDLIKMVGERPAVRSYQLGKEAIDKLEALVSELGDKCELERKPSLYLASKPAHIERLRKEVETRRKHGFADEFLEASNIKDRFPFAGLAGIWSADDAQVDAYRLTHVLMKRAVKHGLRVYDRCTVAEFLTTEQGMELITEAKLSIAAKHVVFATGYESQQYLKEEAGSLHSTFALISEPVEPFPEWPERCLIWETARPYLYLRTTDDNRIIVGGEDTKFASDHRRDRLVEKKTQALVNKFQTLFPNTNLEVAYSWAGTFGATKDGLAYIGQTSQWPHASFALGYGGNGITYSVIAAQLITDHYLGRPNPDAGIFRFGR